LSTIPATGTVILGFLAGQMICYQIEALSKIRKLIMYAILLIVVGAIWGFVFPINKALWTTSYVPYSAEIGMLTFALLIFIIDIKGYVNR